MQYIAKSRTIKMSPRKIRLVVDKIRNLDLIKALTYLDFIEKRASVPVRKTIKSAVANAVNNFKAKREDLLIKEIQVFDGVSYKRYHFAARGRVRPYKRRTSNITVILTQKLEKKEGLQSGT